MGLHGKPPLIHIKPPPWKYFEKYQGTRGSGQKSEIGGRNPHKKTDKEIYLLGVEFTDWNVGEWVVEKMSSGFLTGFT